MPVTTAIATFFLIWWVTLFAVLPWGIRSQHEGQGDRPDMAPDMAPEMAPGTDPGAPVSFRLGRRLLWTTLVAVVIYAAFYWVYTKHWVTLDDLTAPLFGRNR
jgi:predicted secreted protein